MEGAQGNFDQRRKTWKLLPSTESGSPNVTCDPNSLWPVQCYTGKEGKSAPHLKATKDRAIRALYLDAEI